MSDRASRWHWAHGFFLFFRLNWFVLAFVTVNFLFEKATQPTLIRVLLVIALIVPLYYWRPGKTNPVGFILAETILTGGLAIYLNGWLGGETTFLTIPSIFVGFFSGGRRALWSGPLFTVLLPLLHLLPGRLDLADLIPMFVNNVVAFLVGYAFAWTGAAQQRLKKLLEENERQYRVIEEQNQALMQYAQQVEQFTLLEERNRMARELHDTVGHTLTSVIMGMDAAMYLMDSVPSKARERLEVLREAARGGLQEVRRNLQEIAPEAEEERLPITLAGIANEFAVHTATQIRLAAQGEEYPVSTAVRLTLIRCLQESLTNAKRHGEAMTVLITLAYAEDGLQLRIEDDGIGMDETAYGFGLTAMRERAAAQQGTLEISSRPGAGAVVTCTIPRR